MDSPIHISDITRFIKRFGNKRARNLFRLRTKQNDVTRLARKFANSDNRDEDAWAKEIVGDRSTSQAYVRLRSQFKRRLLGHLFDLDLNKGSLLRKMMYSNMRRVFMIRVLVMLGARRAAMSLVPAALARARKFEFTSDTIEMLRISRTNAAFEGKRIEFLRYDEELTRMLLLRIAENRIISLHERFDVESVGLGSVSTTLEKLAAPSLKEAREIYQEFPTFNVGINYFRIATTVAEIEGNFRFSIRLCDESAFFLHQYPHHQNKSFDGEFAVKKLTAALSLRSLEEGQSAAKDCEKYFESGTNNWFVMMEYQFLLYMHTQRFDLASLCLKSVESNGRFESQAEQVRQKWSVFGLYLDFVFYPDRVQKARALNKLVRNVPIYAKDKAGYNISLLILYYLILVDRGRLDEIVMLCGAMNQYLTRYLRTRKSSPLYAFLKCLVLFQRHNFNLRSARPYTTRYIRQFSTGYYSIEESQVLAYSDMWDRIITGVERAHESMEGNR